MTEILQKTCMATLIFWRSSQGYSKLYIKLVKKCIVQTDMEGNLFSYKLTIYLRKKGKTVDWWDVEGNRVMLI